MKKSFLTKKILIGITTMMLSTNLTAGFTDYNNTCRNFDSVISKVMSDAAYEAHRSRTNPLYIKVRTEVCGPIMSRYGVNATITTTNRGLSKQYGVNEYCVNMDKYIEHINDRYKKEGDITLLYKFYANVFRLRNTSVYNLKSKDLFGSFEVEDGDSQHYRNIMLAGDMLDHIVAYQNDKIVNAVSFRIARHFYAEGYMGVEKQVGFSNKDFNKFMSAVMIKDFYTADKMLNKYDGKGIRKQLFKQCKKH